MMESEKITYSLNGEKSCITFHDKAVIPLSERIPGFLEVLTEGNETRCNITSKVSLEDVILRRKISKENIAKLIRGIADAYSELYKNGIDGELILDRRYIYINSGNFSPYFIAVYCGDTSSDELIKGFLIGLITDNIIELTDDNFIQELLEVINSNNFDLNALKCFADRYTSTPQNATKPRNEIQKKVYHDTPSNISKAVCEGNSSNQAINALFTDMTVGTRMRRKKDADALAKIRREQSGISEKIADLNTQKNKVKIRERKMCFEFYIDRKKHTIPLNQGTTIIGSKPEYVDYVINSRRVSRIHAEFMREGNDVYIRDCGSKNGTYINGRRIENDKSYLLQKRDKVMLADIELYFKF